MGPRWFRQTEPAPAPNSEIADTMEEAKTSFKLRYAEVNRRSAWRPGTRAQRLRPLDISQANVYVLSSCLRTLRPHGVEETRWRRRQG
jgi:hypothetical protein